MKMNTKAFFSMEIKNLFGITGGRGIVFEGTILQGTVALGDKLEYSKDDGTRVSAYSKEDYHKR